MYSKVLFPFNPFGVLLIWSLIAGSKDSKSSGIFKLILSIRLKLPEPEIASESETSDLRKLSTEELQILLDDAVREEDYDAAMEIQEELKRRNKNID